MRVKRDPLHNLIERTPKTGKQNPQKTTAQQKYE